MTISGGHAGTQRCCNDCPNTCILILVKNSILTTLPRLPSWLESWIFSHEITHHLDIIISFLTFSRLLLWKIWYVIGCCDECTAAGRQARTLERSTVSVISCRLLYCVAHSQRLRDVSHHYATAAVSHRSAPDRISRRQVSWKSSRAQSAERRRLLLKTWSMDSECDRLHSANTSDCASPLFSNWLRFASKLHERTRWPDRRRSTPVSDGWRHPRPGQLGCQLLKPLLMLITTSSEDRQNQSHRTGSRRWPHDFDSA